MKETAGTELVPAGSFVTADAEQVLIMNRLKIEEDEQPYRLLCNEYPAAED